jgi:hypothetical protein
MNKTNVSFTKRSVQKQSTFTNQTDIFLRFKRSSACTTLKTRRLQRHQQWQPAPDVNKTNRQKKKQIATEETASHAWCIEHSHSAP